MRRPRASLRVAPELVIPPDELVYQAARAGGPGGQNVNKVESKIVLRFDVRRSRALTEDQRQLLLERLAGRLTTKGELVLHSARFREQGRNATAARERLLEILQAAVAPRAVRKATRPKRSASEKRLASKHKRSLLKRGRSRGSEE